MISTKGTHCRGCGQFHKYKLTHKATRLIFVARKTSHNAASRPELFQREKEYRSPCAVRELTNAEKKRRDARYKPTTVSSSFSCPWTLRMMPAKGFVSPFAARRACARERTQESTASSHTVGKCRRKVERGTERVASTQFFKTSCGKRNRVLCRRARYGQRADWFGVGLKNPRERGRVGIFYSRRRDLPGLRPRDQHYLGSFLSDSHFL